MRIWLFACFFSLFFVFFFCFFSFFLQLRDSLPFPDDLMVTKDSFILPLISLWHKDHRDVRPFFEEIGLLSPVYLRSFVVLLIFLLSPYF